MSGRDYRSFINSHRAENDKYINRITEGHKTSYKAVDYDELKSLAAQKKFAGHKALLKVKKIQEASKQNKEHNLIKQHKLAWQKEFIKLNNLRKRFQVDIEACIRQGSEQGAICETIFEDFEEYESHLVKDFAQFKSDTVDPIWNLREDLEYWLVEHQKDEKDEQTIKEDHQRILETVDNVKEQQAKLLERLYNEQISLEKDILSGDLKELSHPSEKKVQQGIPQEAFDLECPDGELKASVLKEFIILDEKYRERLEKLDEQHSVVLTSELGGWDEEDHYLFLFLIEQYPPDVSNRRMLYIDRLRRHFPSMTRTELVEHEDWTTLHKHYHDRKRAVIHDWVRDRRELFDKAQAVFAEACIEYELEAVKNELMTQQKEMCAALYEKVKLWREQKLEAMYLEQQILEQKKREEDEKLRREQEKEKKRREQDKSKLKEYHDQRIVDQINRDQENRRRLEELQKMMAEQAVHDKERVRYREKMLLEKEQALWEKAQERQREEEEREDRLEKLRSTVRPIVEISPERVYRDTESWQSRKTGEEEHINIQKPLFEINSFTSKQINSDSRLRLEQKLRNAGLVNTDYARHMMSQMQPPTQPRRDMESTVFKK